MHARCKYLAAAVLIGAAAAALLAPQPQPALIYNHSNSVPSGFYVRENRAPMRGDFVTVRPPAGVRDYVLARGFGDQRDHFLKRVRAVAGARVCAEDQALTIDGALAARRARQDSAGRALPSWSGCRDLGADEVLLLGDTEDSFDGRYWGPTPRAAIDGVWRPLAR